MLIYVNGDSFAAGVGLADHKFIPGYTNYLPADRNRQIEYSRYRGEYITDLVTIDEKANSWPSRLGVEVINDSEGGSSMSSILYRTLIGLSNLKQKSTLPDEVIIHLTAPERISVIDSREFHMASTVRSKNPWIQSWLLGYSKGDKEQLCTEIVKHLSFDDLFIQFLLEVNLLNLCVAQLIGKPPILVLTNRSVAAQCSWMIQSQKFSNDIIDLCKSSRILEIPPELTMATYSGTAFAHTLPCGHFDDYVTTRFAEAIKAII